MIPTFPFALPTRVKHRTLLCSMASGNHIRLLRLMEKTVHAYAELHGMDSLVLPLDSPLANDRSPMWDKIILIRHLLKEYETVIWLDADAIIRDPWRSMEHELDPSHPLQIVAHHYDLHGTGTRVTVPNTGVMAVRRTDALLNFLEAVWDGAEFREHGWGENAAIMDLIGFDPRGFACTYRGETAYSPIVSFLGRECNSIPLDQAANPIILHYCCGWSLDARAEAMAGDLAIFEDRLREGAASRMRVCQETFLHRLTAQTETEGGGPQ